MSWLQATCTECGAHRKVRRHELDRAARPRCLKCGGRIELSANAQEKLGKVATAQHEGAVPDQRKTKPCAEAPRILPEHEARRYEFWQHPMLFDWMETDAASLGKKVPFTREEYYDPANGQVPRVDGDDAWASRLVLLCESALLHSGRPYYKLWPGITNLLCDTEIRIPGEHFAMPCDGLEIRFPKEDNPMLPACAAVVARVSEDLLPHGDGRDYSVVVMFFDNIPEFSMRDDAGYYSVADIGIRENQLLEDSLDQTRLMAESPHPDLVRRLVRVAVGTCFFAIDKHEMILPEIRRRTIDRLLGQRRQPTLREANEALAEAKELGLHGFKVGSEIALPRPLARQDDTGGAGTHGLTVGYLRRGHMRMQPVGKGREGRKLIFVHPHMVRADLPIAPRGYRIGQPEKPARKLP